MINFLEETIRCLNAYGKTELDVLWVGRGFRGYDEIEKTRSTFADFKKKANFKYNNGFGCVTIPLDLIIVGEDFWLERSQYDGSEWWSYKTFPEMPSKIKELELEVD